MSDGLYKNNNEKTVKHYLLGGIVGVLITIASMLAFAAVLLFFNVDREYSVPFATISVALGSYFASRITAKKIGDKGYRIGLIIGFAVFVVITAISLILGNNLSLNTLFHFIIIMLSSLIGGITGVNKKEKYKKLI